MPKSIFDVLNPGKRKRTLTSADKKRIAAGQKWRCNLCHKLLPSRYHIDHIKEHASGGSDKESNLQALCPNCHAEKHEEHRNRKKQSKIKEGNKIPKGPWDIQLPRIPKPKFY